MSSTFRKYKLFVPEYADVDYNSASEIIIDYASKRNSFGVSALAVHGLIESLVNVELRDVINKIDLIVPDGQPVRWALNSFYKLGMKERVYGPELTLWVLKKANIEGLSVYLYGSTEDTLTKLNAFIQEEFPNVVICGMHIDRFRDASDEEDKEDIEKINESKANIVLVGRGCPRQEFWVADHKGKVNAVMMAVGAAFDFHAGTLKQAPNWMQGMGLEWLYRLFQEPKRLWKRYLLTNSMFIYYYLKFKLLKKDPSL
ncbi:glycosyl transferase [Roseivirga sp. 4D4]|uniref:WecB/TagA/CpsF family glycosyltransferase n=1 Tax=Roseivirga sp. 4D4 TaxID=1889784 RepID=UPI000852FD89|nr:WecB/TagA/CpsF family glycosyltransferase [Roseivirga sp. 4D4]OEK02477.1 glycosyl transferase [Roseivirga sp. 4D4]